MSKKKGNRRTTNSIFKKEKSWEEMDATERLMWQIEVLKKAPKDFRDIPVGSKMWEDLIKAWPEKAGEMIAWAHGPIWCFGRRPSRFERQVLAGLHKDVVLHVCEPTQLHMGHLYGLLSDMVEATANNFPSFLYLKGFPGEVGTSLNLIFRTFNVPTRVKAEITDSSGQHYASD